MSERDGRNEFPSLEDNPFAGQPSGWVQWKGTNVCMDVHCACGAHTHIDAEFCYHIKCSACGQVYEVGGNVKLYPLDFEPENTKVTEADE